MGDLHERGAADLADMIGRGETSCEEVVAALLERAAAFQGLNVFTSLDPDDIRRAARAADSRDSGAGPVGPLHGVPITLKDNIGTAGTATTAGTPALRHHKPARDSAIVERLVSAGAVPFGKNGLHELALGATSNNAAFGAVRNPYATDCIPGGSSGGTGAAVAARLAPAGIGTDTGGSVRIPAALCGVMGLRPTTGRWPGGGIVPISASRDTPGPIARCMRDLALLDTVAVGEVLPVAAATLRGKRLGVPRSSFWRHLEPEIGDIAESALRLFAAAGVTLVDVDLPDLAQRAGAISFVLVTFEMPRDLDLYLSDHGGAADFERVVEGVASPDVRRILESVRAERDTTALRAAYREAIDTHLPQLRARYDAAFRDHALDGLVFPTTPVTAPRIGDDETIVLNGENVPTFMTLIRNTDPGSVAGIPGLTMPIGANAAGKPVGLAIDAARGGDRALLSIGLALERTVPPLPAPTMA